MNYYEPFEKEKNALEDNGYFVATPRTLKEFKNIVLVLFAILLICILLFGSRVTFQYLAIAPAAYGIYGIFAIIFSEEYRRDKVYLCLTLYAIVFFISYFIHR